MLFKRALVLLPFLIACGGEGEPLPSYCETVCDHAITCAETDRPVDATTLEAECLAGTQAADPTCANAEDGSLNPIAREAVEKCNTAINDLADAGTCDDMTGRIDDLKIATAPTACAATGSKVQEVYKAAQDSVTESGEGLCTRFTNNFCVLMDEKLVADFGTIPQSVTDELGTITDHCISKLDFQTSSCISNDLYAPEASIEDANAGRQGARECLRSLDLANLEAVLSGDADGAKECAFAFTSTEDLLAFGSALVEVGTDVSALIE
ncbi:MAG: hypothetical protein GWP91_23810 [Rhodobacterales bacterium]|nr:hypothetical protein [Rhodobacterales bacterium]